MAKPEINVRNTFVKGVKVNIKIISGKVVKRVTKNLENHVI